MRDFPESDWKLLKRIQPVALDRLCRRLLSEVKEACGRDRPSHQQFLAVFSQVMKGNEAISRGFDDLRRSTACFRLAAMRKAGAMTDEEFSQFSEITQNSVNVINGV